MFFLFSHNFNSQLSKCNITLLNRMNLLKSSNSFRLYRFLLTKTRATSVIFSNPKLTNHYQTFSELKSTSNSSKNWVNLHLEFKEEYKQSSSSYFQWLLIAPFILLGSFRKAQCEIKSFNEKNECKFY